MRVTEMERILVTDPDRVTVDQLERAFRGQAVLETGNQHHDHWTFRELRLSPPALEDYQRARQSGFLAVQEGSYKHTFRLEKAWRLYCAAAGRPEALILAYRNRRTIKFKVNVPRDHGLPEEILPQLEQIVATAVAKGDRYVVATYGVTAALRDLGTARELMVPVLDLVLESLRPETGGLTYRTKRGIARAYYGSD